MTHSLLFYRTQSQLLILAYCLMPDHLHILASPQGGANLSTVLGSYESYVTQLAWGYGVMGKLWQRSFHDHVLRQSDDVQAVIAYILNNPVEAGLVRAGKIGPGVACLTHCRGDPSAVAPDSSVRVGGMRIELARTDNLT